MVSTAYGRPGAGRSIPVSWGPSPAPRPVPRADRRGRLSAHVWVLTLGLAAAGAGAWFGGLLDRATPPAASVAEPAAEDPAAAFAVKPTPAIDALADARPIWIRVADPDRLLAVDSSLTKDLAATYEARRHGLGGRQDILTYGSFGSGERHVRLSLYRPGGEAPPPSTFFVEAVRQAAEAGIGVVRTDVPTGLDTRLGLVEAAEGVLAADGVERACLLFRYRAAGLALDLSGWACEAEGKAVARADLAALIDGIRLLKPAAEPSLAAAFPAIEPARKPSRPASRKRP